MWFKFKRHKKIYRQQLPIIMVEDEDRNKSAEQGEKEIKILFYFTGNLNKIYFDQN